MRSNHTAAEWVQVFQRMALYAPGSTPLQPQMLAGGITRDRTRGVDPKAIGEWLASVNASYNSKERIQKAKINTALATVLKLENLNEQTPIVWMDL